MFENRIFTINSLKYDGHIHRSWQAEFIEETADLLIFKGIFDEEVKHKKLGVIRHGTISHEFFWKNRGYNVFRFHEPEGDLRNFYCNINQPPVVGKDFLNYIDLDIDVLVWKDFSIEVLDLDEFEENAAKYNYPNDLREKVQQDLEEVLSLIKNKIFPFDFQI